MKAWEGCASRTTESPGAGVVMPVDAVPEVDVSDAVEPWSSDEATDGSGVGAEPRSPDGPPTDAPEVGSANSGEVEPRAATKVVQADAEVSVDAMPDANADVVEQ